MSIPELKKSRGLYIHIPFCIKKCSYCDFFSLPAVSPQHTSRYIDGVQQEIWLRAKYLEDTVIKTVYLGGGTPSLLTPSQISSLLDCINNSFTLDKDAEICMEANPATLDFEKIQAITRAGVNRLSLGIQSFDDSELRVLGRSHTAGEALNTIMLLRDAGFENYNLDLIYGIPGQTISSWEQTLNKALKTQPRHLSIYLLQLDEKTPLACKIKTGEVQLLDEEDELLMYNIGINLITEAGLQQYEISNFARPGYESRHNLIYWNAMEYIGIGAGAVSFINGKRYMNRADLQLYLAAAENGKQCMVEELECMDEKALIVDAIILGLRLCQGIDLHDFELRFGIKLLKEYKDIINTFIDENLLMIEDGRLKITKKAYFVSNQVLCGFIE